MIINRHLPLAAAVIAFLPAAAMAQASTTSGEDDKAKDAAASSEAVQSITVFGWRDGNSAPLELSSDPLTDTASVSVITKDDIVGKITSSTADLLRGTSGVQISDFGQVGEAQGITMRGWSNGYDGSFVAYYQDGFQRNQPSNISVNGYLDINPLIPETVNRFTVIRGPFDIRYGGNFAQAGSVVATTRDYLPTGLSVSGGSFGYVRTLAVDSYKDDTTTFYTAIDAARQDGYRDNSNSKDIKTFSKFGTDLTDGHLTLGLETYNISFHQPGYIDLGDIKAGSLSPRADANGTDHGSVNTYTLTSNYTTGNDIHGLDASVNAGHNYMERYTTTTPFPQFYRSDERWTTGGNIDSHWNFKIPGDIDTLALAGVSIQNDIAQLNELPSIDGNTINGINALDEYYYKHENFTQTDTAGYGSLAIKPISWLKITTGLRYDYFSYDINNHGFDSTSFDYTKQQFTAGTGRLSPKVGVAIQPVPTVTLYANYGESPRSPSAATELTGNAKLSSSYLRNEEVGVAYDSPQNRVHLQANGYHTINSNEIGEVGYQIVNLGTSKRDGYDLEAGLGLFRTDSSRGKLTASYNYVRAKLADNGYVPYVAKWLGAYGFQLQFPAPEGNLRFDINHEFVGPQKLDSAGAFTSTTYSRLATKISYEIPQLNDLTVWVGAIYYPGDVYSEFAFDLYNRVYTNPVARVQLQSGMSIHF